MNKVALQKYDLFIGGQWYRPLDGVYSDAIRQLQQPERSWHLLQSDQRRRGCGSKSCT